MIDIFELSAYDHTGYPVVDFGLLKCANNYLRGNLPTSGGSKPIAMPAKRKILGLMPGGKCEVIIKDRVNTEVEINVRELEGYYIGEWTDRLIEIIIYQITEVVIPTVFTYQKYWDPRELKKMAVEFLLYEPFAQVKVNLYNVALQIPSMADFNELLSVEVKNCKIWNQRYHKKRIFNPD